jgi:hypothetical protein
VKFWFSTNFVDRTGNGGKMAKSLNLRMPGHLFEIIRKLWDKREVMGISVKDKTSRLFSK